MTAIRPRRSLLFMPASNPRALDKGKGLDCDGIIFDLEDAVSPDAKIAAREGALAALRGGGYGGRELILRVNGLDTPWGRDDLAAAATAGADGVMLPKVEAPAHVHQAQAVLAAHGAAPQLPIWCMIETPRGVLAAEAVAGASPAVAGLMVGTNDLGKALGCRHTPGRDAFLTSFGLCILAARAHGIAVIDGTHPDLSDDAGFEVACRQARDLGFDGKALIHPKTIAGANRIFAPAEADIAWAQRIIAAYGEGTGGAIAVDGRLVERLHVEEAERLVALAAAIAARG